MKSLIIQAENDTGDLAEMVQGSLTAMKIKPNEDTFKALKTHLEIRRLTSATGEEFADGARTLIGKYKPDIVWLDPLLSFIGDDISRQDVCSYFLRNLLNPIAFESGVTWMMMHHTPKPSADPKSKTGWNRTDHSYAGTGSAELTNWASAVCLLRSTRDEGRFQLVLAKRGKRAGATDLEGNRTTSINLKHVDDGILWEQTPEPVLIKAAPKSKKPKKTVERLDELIAKIDKPMKKSKIIALAEEDGHSTKYIAQRDWSIIAKKLKNNSDKTFQNKN